MEALQVRTLTESPAHCSAGALDSIDPPPLYYHVNTDSSPAAPTSPPWRRVCGVPIHMSSDASNTRTG